MNHFPKLANPPAVEAILDVGVVFPNGVDLTALKELHDAFRPQYPKLEEQRVVEFAVKQQRGGTLSEPHTRDHGVVGYRFRSEDGTELVQCRKDGFTFNRLKPYTGWEDVSQKAKTAWEVYRASFPQAQIVRVALRYINLIDVPVVASGAPDLAKWFSVALPTPPVEGVTVSNFVTQSVLHDAASSLDANWTFARQAQPPTSKPAVVIDIDVFATGALVSEKDVPDLWAEMRHLKNRLFFGSFTNDGLALFA